MLRCEAIERGGVEEAQTVVFNHDEIIVSVNEVQEQTVVVISAIRLVETLFHHDEIEPMNGTVIEEVALRQEEPWNEGSVIAREELAGQATKHEKKDRTKKERKSKAVRKTKGEGVRQPMRLSLDSRVVTTLNAMGMNKSALFVELLQHYDPFLEAWTELGHDEEGNEAFDHDQIEDGEE